MLQLKIWRKRRKITQDGLARMVGVSHPTISNWENGGFEPSLKNAKKLADVLGIEIEDLLEENKNEKE